MQEITKLLNESNKYLKTADHLTYITYPLLKDNKLIISITENLTEAMTKAMEALLYYDHYYKRISYFPNDFKSKLETFKLSCVPRYNIDRSFILMLQDLKELVDLRKQSKMEFIRNNKYVIALNNFDMKSLSYEKVKKFLNDSKPFFNKLNLILKNVKTQ